MMEALWVHQWHNRVNEKLLTRMLRSSDPWARAAATRVLCYWRDRVANPLDAAQDAGHRRASRRAARSGPRRELLPDAGSGRGGARLARPAAGSLPEVHARPDDEHAQAVRPVKSEHARTAVCASSSVSRLSRRYWSCAASGARARRTRRESCSISRFAPSSINSAGSTNEELVLVERKEGDVRYRPVYFALLTRKGVAAAVPRRSADGARQDGQGQQERGAARGAGQGPRGRCARPPRSCSAFSWPSPPTAPQGARDVRRRRSMPRRARRSSLRGAYGGRHGRRRQAGRGLADRRSSTTAHLVGAAAERALPSGRASRREAPRLRGQLFAPIAALLADERRIPSTRTAALDALGWTRRDAATFDLLAREVKPDAEAASRAAAIASLQRIPESAWPPAAIEPLARAIVAVVRPCRPIGAPSPMRSTPSSSARSSPRSCPTTRSAPSAATCARSASRSCASRRCPRNSAST